MSRISDLAGFSTSLSSTQDLSVGVITATTFSGDGSGLTGVASTDNIQTATDAKFLANVNITGVATANSFVGDGSALTGIDATSIKDSGGNVKAQANPGGVVVTGVITATTGSFDGNVSVGGVLTYADVTNVDSVGMVTARKGLQVLADGANITGIVTATSFSGDGSGLTGVGVGTEDNINTSGIITATKFVGSGTSLVFAPKIIAFNPLALQQNVAVGSSIHITFDQNIHFVGSGDVVIREGSSDGTGIQTFSITSGAAASGLSIVDTQLIIEPSSDFSFSTSIYVTLPSTGIANTEGDSFAGSSNYNFGTVNEAFSAQGGDIIFTRADPGSPTNYYKYHIFTSRTGILTTSAPSATASDLYVMMVAGGGAGGWGPNAANGGGGGGGVLIHTGPTLAISSGTFPIGVGTGGHPDAAPHTGDPMRGGNTTISSPTATIVSAIGGGGGGYNFTYTPPGTVRSGQPGGSGGGAAYPIGPTAGSGTSGQGNNGGSTGTNGGGGGGGGGGTGGSPTPPPTQPTNVVTAGAGGAGKPVSAFSSTVLSGYVPTISPGVVNTIGPTGLYGGGGGASYTGSSPLNLGGSPGPGGGGSGAGPLGGTGSNTGENGINLLGGGGGAGKGPSPVAARGGDGVLMIRYETPAP